MTNKQVKKATKQLISVGNIDLPTKIETVEDLIDLRNKIDDALKKAKQDLVGYMVEQGEEKLETEDFSIRVWNETRVSCPDVKKVSKKYLKEVEIDNILERDGKYYQLQGNTDLVKNELVIGGELPKGFEVKKIQKASLKVGGKTV